MLIARRVLVPHAGVADQREVRLEVSLVLLEDGTKFFDPISSSPSMTMVTSTGSDPVTDFQARQASTKVINCPLSSALLEPPRATRDLAAVADRPQPIDRRRRSAEDDKGQLMTFVEAAAPGNR